DDLAAAIARHRALPEGPARVHDAELTDADRDAVVVGLHDGGLDVFEALVARVAAEHDLLARRLDVAAAADAVVLLDRGPHVLDRDAVRGEARRIERHAVLLERAAEADDLDDAGHLAELRPELPLDDRAELFGRSAPALQL